MNRIDGFHVLDILRGETSHLRLPINKVFLYMGNPVHFLARPFFFVFKTHIRYNAYIGERVRFDI